jgi:UDP-glucose 4-epimerase
VDAALLADKRKDSPYETYNVATGDYVSVREIAELSVECLGLAKGSTTYEFTGGDRGWEGDIPVVRMSTERARSIGWSNSMTSTEALAASLAALRGEVLAGRH